MVFGVLLLWGKISKTVIKGDGTCSLLVPDTLPASAALFAPVIRFISYSVGRPDDFIQTVHETFFNFADLTSLSSSETLRA